MNSISTYLLNLAYLSIQIGEIKALSGDSIPSGWKLCDGSVVSRQTYAKLFDVCGTVWGGGDGSTTFCIPDLRGRTIIGAGESTASGHTAHLLGELSGEEKHTLSVAELASHDHISGKGYNNIGTGGKGIVPNNGAYHDGTNSNYTSNTGSNSSHNTMQPYSTCEYIIYTGVDV